MEAIAGYSETETREIMKKARAMAEWRTCSLEEIIGEIMSAVARGESPEKVKGEFLQFKTAWDRKEDRERQRAAGRADAVRFSRQKERERAQRRQKRTRPRRREYRGPPGGLMPSASPGKRSASGRRGGRNGRGHAVGNTEGRTSFDRRENGLH